MTDPVRVPTGTVTCLFSDIEGSTRLEVELGTATYGTIRERHREILRTAFGAHAGVEHSTEGDSFFVVFERAPDAIAAAVDGQRAVVAEPWPSDAEVAVRMGLHTGEIAQLGADVIGLAINRTARIASVAHGGQVLLSDATRALLGDGLPPGVTLRDLGQHRLKDLRAPERLAQLVIDGLRADFPPLRSIDARPNNLPTQLTTFVGREQEVAEAVGLLGQTRLLTFTGPGGTGKTRLSLQVAGAAADRYPDGLWFVALETVRDPDRVAPTIARTLGLVEGRDRSALDILVDELGERHVLLVLDNFEQVVGAGPVDRRAAAALSERVGARHDPGRPARVRGAGVPGARSAGAAGHAPPLRGRAPQPPPFPARVRPGDADDQYEAVRLFIARATSVKPGFAVTNANAPAVAAISARLHGMPLAIELAAARVKLLTPDQILARLEHAPGPADRRRPRPARAAADPARRDRLELRPARRRGAPPGRPAVGLPRRVPARDRRDGVRSGGGDRRRRHRPDRGARRPEPRPRRRRAR